MRNGCGFSTVLGNPRVFSLEAVIAGRDSHWHPSAAAQRESSQLAMATATPGVSSAATSRINVTVRVRPSAAAGCAECISCDPERATLTIELGATGHIGAPSARRMRFDSVHDGRTTQDEFFERSNITALLDAALDGYNATVFAYGQTGSGKTYTMGEAGASGDSGGLMRRAARYLYAGMAARAGVAFTVQATYLEVYNEQVVDLVVPRSEPLAVRGGSGGFYVEDLSVVQCRGLHDLEYVISKGLEQRSTRDHSMNQHSSRSHAMFSIYVDAVEADGTSKRYGRVSLLDLAGSENVRATDSTGGGLKEAGQINRSLFALGQARPA